MITSPVFVSFLLFCFQFQNSEVGSTRGKRFINPFQDICKIDCEGETPGNPVLSSIPTFCLFIGRGLECKKTINPDKINMHITTTSMKQVEALNMTLQMIQNEIKTIGESVQKAAIEAAKIALASRNDTNTTTPSSYFHYY